ncbi:restriction endonuclease subunit S [Vibrio sp. PNB22_3_1]
MSELPKGWSNSTLDKMIPHDAIISDGDWVESKDQDPSGSVRLIQLADIGDGDFRNKSQRFMNEEAANRLNCSFLEKGDLLVARMPDPLGRACLFPNVGQRAVTVVDVCFVRETLLSAVSNKLLQHWFNSPYIRGLISANASGSTRKRITRKKLEKFEFPVPPLAEQTRIVEKLDEVLAQVDTIKARLDGIPALLKRFRQSVLASAVSGKLTGVVDFSVDKFSNLILEMKNGLSPKPNEDGFGSPILRISSVRPKEVDFEDHRFLECEDKTKNIYSLRDRDLLFTRYNGSLEFVGVCGIVSGIGDKTYLYPDKLIRVRTDEKLLLPEYAELFFCCASTRKTITDFVKSTSGQKGISGKDLKSVDVSYPNLTAQKEIVRLVDQYFAFADTIEAQVKKAQARVNNLTQSILAKAFRGELVAQDPNDEPADKLLERIALARKEAEALAKAAKKAGATKKKAANKTVK